MNKEHVLNRRSGNELPIPVIQSTIAFANSEAQKILDRIAKSEKVGARESMKFEILRICTYRNFPTKGIPYAILLAGAGFYYASTGTVLICYCCGIRKSDWYETDNTLKIHKSLRPSCDFIVRNSDVNIPVPELPAEYASKFKNLEVLISGSSPLASQPPMQTSCGSPAPKHSQYAELSARLDSFKKWPSYKPQTPQIMAEYGFYYAGFGDCVRCFHCGIGLRTWTKDDYPWVEHARWSRECAYLGKIKGEEFVNRVQEEIEKEPKD